jgi:hypothetical protein
VKEWIMDPACSRNITVNNKSVAVLGKSIKLTILSGLFVGIAACNFTSPNCEIKELRTLFTIPGVYEGKITGFSHYILIKDFPRKCMDSTTFVTMAVKYVDTVNANKPADVLMFFNSDKYFIPNETSQVMEDINKSCLVVIGFDKKNAKPIDFIFYNESGKRIYWGNRWMYSTK